MPTHEETGPTPEARGHPAKGPARPEPRRLHGLLALQPLAGNRAVSGLVLNDPPLTVQRQTVQRHEMDADIDEIEQVQRTAIGDVIDVQRKTAEIAPLPAEAVGTRLIGKSTTEKIQALIAEYKAIAANAADFENQLRILNGIWKHTHDWIIENKGKKPGKEAAIQKVKDDVNTEIEKVTRQSNATKKVAQGIEEAAAIDREQNIILRNTAKTLKQGLVKWEVAELKGGAAAERSGQGEIKIDWDYVLGASIKDIQGKLAHEVSHVMQGGAENYQDEFNAYWKEFVLRYGDERRGEFVPAIKLALEKYPWFQAAVRQAEEKEGTPRQVEAKATLARWGRIEVAGSWNFNNSPDLWQLQKKLGNFKPEHDFGAIVALAGAMSPEDKVEARREKGGVDLNAYHLPLMHYVESFISTDGFTPEQLRDLWAAVGGAGTPWPALGPPKRPAS